MKQISSMLLFAMVSSFTFSQVNLVLNSSFEDNICSGSNIDCADHWVNPTYFSPDYFRTGGPLGFTVPNNDFGFQVARTGTAYAGIITAMFNANGREYIQSELLDSLKQGIKYCISFYVCIVDSSPFAVNNIGAYLSDSAITSTFITNLPYQPQIDNNPFLNPLSIRNTWIEVSDTFTALGGEKFITIGNFHDDASTDTTHDSIVTAWPVYGYYYIDDVNVSFCDSTSGIEDNNSLSDITISQYHSNSILIINSNKMNMISVGVYDCRGKVVFNKFINAVSTEIDLNQNHSGIYFIKVLLKDTLITKKILIINKN